MILLEDAFALLRSKIGDHRVPTETLAVRQAANRVVASDQRSKVQLPPFNKAAVDGYAIVGGDPHDEYSVAGVVVAGQPGIDTLEPGTAVKVMTGAPVPSGTAKVIMVEHATERNGRVRFDGYGAGNNICRIAEDVDLGQTIVTAGTRLGPLHIANLISCGISEVEVARQVRVAIFSTGDEIVESFEQLSPGKIMNTNGPLLSALGHRWGMAVVAECAVPDDRAKLKEALERESTTADMVVLSGGVSEGDYDFVPEVITDCGYQIHFSRVAVKPGLPTAFATRGKSILFGLPGNPVAVYVMFHLLVLRAVETLSGGTCRVPEMKVRLASEVTRRSAARTEFCPCRILDDGRAEKTAYHGSAHLTALMESDGFLVIPNGVQSLPAGAEATLVMFSERFD